MIDDKLTTGYYGVRHLFLTNNDKEGRLSRESFKCILSQLCGYINSDTWQKIVSKFDLDGNNGSSKGSISFEEFIGHFENNLKVRKEWSAAVNNVQLIDMTYGSGVTQSCHLLPELSATYCFALLKAKVKEELVELCVLKT